MDKKGLQSIVQEIKNNNIFNDQVNDLFDIVDNLEKTKFVSPIHTSIVRLNLTSELILNKANQHLKFFDLSIPQKNVLESLYFNNKPLTQAQISKFVFSSKSNISTLLNRMENKGFIKRYENPKNKREKLIELTKKGKLKFEELIEVGAKYQSDLDMITLNEANELTRILNKLKIGFENFAKKEK